MYSHSCGHFESKGQDDEKLWHFGVSSFRPIFWSSKANSQSRRQPRTFSSHLARCVSPPTNWAQFYGHVAREQDGDRSAGVFSLRFARPNHVFFRFWKIFWKHMEVKSPCWPFFWEDREMFPVTVVWVSSLSRTRNIFCSTLGTCHCWDGKLNGRTQTTWNPWLSEDMWSFLHENIWFEHVWTI